MKPPVLFIHGAFTCAARWGGWVSLFGDAGYPCAAPSLPGHEPADRTALARLTFDDYVAAMRDVAVGLGRPPVVVGHSMGGLIAQHLAAATDCAALVLVSSPPPWRLRLNRNTAPYSWRYALPVLTGRPVRATDKVARKLVLHDLAVAEQDELLSTFTWESGKAYRTMVLGLAPMERSAVACPVLCVSGGADRMLDRKARDGLAAFYGAEHMVFPGLGHSLVAGSLAAMVGQPVLRWIDEKAAAAPEAVMSEASFPVSAVV